MKSADQLKTCNRTNERTLKGSIVKVTRLLILAVALPTAASAYQAREDLPSCDNAQSMVQNSNSTQKKWAEKVCECVGDMKEALMFAAIGQSEYDRQCAKVSKNPPSASKAKPKKTGCSKVWNELKNADSCEEAKDAKQAIKDAKCNFGPKSRARYKKACESEQSNFPTQTLLALILSIGGIELLLRLINKKTIEFISKVNKHNIKFADALDKTIEESEEVGEPQKSTIKKPIIGTLSAIRHNRELYEKKLIINTELAYMQDNIDEDSEPEEETPNTDEEPVETVEPSEETPEPEEETPEPEEPEVKTMSLATLLAIINDDDEDDDDDEW